MNPDIITESEPKGIIADAFNPAIPLEKVNWGRIAAISRAAYAQVQELTHQRFQTVLESYPVGVFESALQSPTLIRTVMNGLASIMKKKPAAHHDYNSPPPRYIRFTADFGAIQTVIQFDDGGVVRSLNFAGINSRRTGIEGMRQLRQWKHSGEVQPCSAISSIFGHDALQAMTAVRASDLTSTSPTIVFYASKSKKPYTESLTATTEMTYMPSLLDDCFVCNEGTGPDIPSSDMAAMIYELLDTLPTNNHTLPTPPSLDTLR